MQHRTQCNSVEVTDSKLVTFPCLSLYSMSSVQFLQNVKFCNNFTSYIFENFELIYVIITPTSYEFSQRLSPHFSFA